MLVALQSVAYLLLYLLSLASNAFVSSFMVLTMIVQVRHIFPSIPPTPCNSIQVCGLLSRRKPVRTPTPYLYPTIVQQPSNLLLQTPIGDLWWLLGLPPQCYSPRKSSYYLFCWYWPLWAVVPSYTSAATAPQVSPYRYLEVRNARYLADATHIPTFRHTKRRRVYTNTPIAP